MAFLHTEIVKAGRSKNNNRACGDVTDYIYDKSGLIFILTDGIGSGIKANLAARMNTARLKQLIISGYSLREAFLKVINTIEENKASGKLYSAITVVKIADDGVTTVLGYEIPPPVFISKNYSTILKRRTITAGKSFIEETNCYLEEKEALLLLTDGITQSGIGEGHPEGWGIDGVNRFVNSRLTNGRAVKELPRLVKDQATMNWGGTPKDDVTAVLLYAHKGKVMNILTGPPSDETKDSRVVRDFLRREGLKVICGASTAKMVARETGEELEMDTSYEGSLAPPEYYLECADLVTEGAVTLNQVYNIWEENPDKLEKVSPVTELYSLLSVVDRVNFIVGSAFNPALEDIGFTQKGILSRKVIIPLLAEKLRKNGKLVVIEELG